MNANELAEIQAFKTEELTMWERNHTATMLRQQQAEIDTYKLQNNNQIDTYKYKNLTNAEIDQILKQHDWYSKTWVDMVRSIESAILRKAQEK